MPRADIGTEETRTGSGKKGEFKVKFLEVSEKIMTAKKPESNFPDSLRLLYEIVGTEDTVSLSVPIEHPSRALLGFCEEPENAPANEKELRAYVSAFAIYDPIFVYVRDSFIRNRLAPEGEHIFTKLIGVWPYDNAEGTSRLGFTATTANGLTATWNCKDPQLKWKIGDTPDQDYVGGETELNPNQWAFQYLQAFGLKWDRLKNDIQGCKALWPGHYDGDGRPIEPLFPDTKNPWQGFLGLIKKHGGNAVKMEIIRHEKWGLGPKRTGQFPIVKMTPVEIVDVTDPLIEEFNREAVRFMEDWEKLTQVLFKRPDVRFMISRNFTTEGRDVAVNIIKPVVYAYPGIVKEYKDNGDPVIHLPPSANDWHLNGIVCLNFLAERLVAIEDEKSGTLFDLINLTNPDLEKLLAWVAENVPELAEPMEESEGEEL